MGERGGGEALVRALVAYLAAIALYMASLLVLLHFAPFWAVVPVALLLKWGDKICDFLADWAMKGEGHDEQASAWPGSGA